MQTNTENMEDYQPFKYCIDFQDNNVQWAIVIVGFLTLALIFSLILNCLQSGRQASAYSHVENGLRALENESNNRWQRGLNARSNLTRELSLHQRLIRTLQFQETDETLDRILSRQNSRSPVGVPQRREARSPTPGPAVSLVHYLCGSDTSMELFESLSLEEMVAAATDHAVCRVSATADKTGSYREVLDPEEVAWWETMDNIADIAISEIRAEGKLAVEFFRQSRSAPMFIEGETVDEDDEDEFLVSVRELMDAIVDRACIDMNAVFNHEHRKPGEN